MNKLMTFDARVGALGAVEGRALAEIIKAASDLALVVDSVGIIRDVHAGEESALAEWREWLGRPWVDTVTPESRPKVEAMLRDAAAGEPVRRREVNHELSDGRELPVAYTAAPVGVAGSVVAMGRDLRAIASLQQRLVEVQQAMERDYWRMRNLETRYRLLFQISSEAVLFVDAASLRVVDANAAALALLRLSPGQLVGRAFPAGLAPAAAGGIEEHLARVRLQGDAEPVAVHTADGRALRLSGALLRESDSAHFLVRLQPADAAAADPAHSRLLEVLEEAPDGFVVADPEGRVLAANRAFLALTQLASEEQVRGESLGRWIGRPGADLPLLLATLREHGVARLFTTALHGAYGSETEVEISVVAVDSEPPCLGLTVRDVGRRVVRGPQGARDLSRAVEELTELVGKVSLKQLVRETTELVERHLIEAALELTGDNRTVAAEVLGVSRQSLYVKLRRFGFEVGEK